MLGLWAGLQVVEGARKSWDTASTVPFNQIHRAFDDLPALSTFIHQWQGPSDLHALDLFGHSCAIRFKFRQMAYRAEAWDLTLSPSHDITTRAGVRDLLSVGLRLLNGALVCAGPPCSLWIFLSSSVHCRNSATHGIHGNPVHEKTQLSNVIVENMVVVLALLHRVRHFHTVIEQPGSSMMFEYPALRNLGSLLGATLIFTWLGLFGHPLCKPTKLFSNLPGLGKMKKKMTRDARLRIKRRQEQAAARARAKGLKPQQYYTKKGKSVTGGSDLQSTAAYPKKFASALFVLWRQAWVQGL